MATQDFKVLSDTRFSELCSVLGVREQCCFAPDKKVIEKAFRKTALKCHPDKGGDQAVFKKLNDAYLKLMGHIRKLDQQVEAEELSNSVLLEISRSSVVRWQEKLQTKYGWFKTDNCKNIIFEGPFKQYMGRSINTGKITIVLYEDPPDSVPKIHIRSRKYMAWIAENSLPTHMHVAKGKTLQFDQWRIAHLAEFGINNLDCPRTPQPGPAKPRTPNTKRKEKAERERSERRSKTRKDSEPSPGGEENKQEEKENTKPSKFGSLFGSLSCGHCGAGFSNLMEYIGHKKLCLPDEQFGFSTDKPPTPTASTEKASDPGRDSTKISQPETQFSSDSQPAEKPANIQEKTAPSLSRIRKESENQSNEGFICDTCQAQFSSMVQYEKHRSICLQTKTSIDGASTEIPMESLRKHLPDSTNPGLGSTRPS